MGIHIDIIDTLNENNAYFTGKFESTVQTAYFYVSILDDQAIIIILII